MGVSKGNVVIILVGITFGIVENAKIEEGELEASFGNLDATSPDADDDWIDFVYLFEQAIETDEDEHHRERRAAGQFASSDQFVNLYLASSVYPTEEPHIVVVEDDDDSTTIVVASVVGSVAAVGGVVVVVVLVKVFIVKAGGKVAATAGTIMVAPATQGPTNVVFNPAKIH